MSRITDLIRSLLFPPKCVACGALLEWETPSDIEALCRQCRGQWESEKADTCGTCAKRVTECACMPAEMSAARCAGFRKLAFYCHGKRNPVQNRLIFHIKERNGSRAPAFLAKELLPSLKALTEKSPDAVLTWVPRSLTAKLRYGTDQASELAKALAAESGLACERLIERRFHPKRTAQKKLTLRERKQSVKALYRPSARAEIKNRTVVLVDDIVTTGSTAAACVRLLRRAGAREVFCLSVASNDTNQA